MDRKVMLGFALGAVGAASAMYIAMSPGKSQFPRSAQKAVVAEAPKPESAKVEVPKVELAAATNQPAEVKESAVPVLPAKAAEEATNQIGSRTSSTKVAKIAPKSRAAVEVSKVTVPPSERGKMTAPVSADKPAEVAASPKPVEKPTIINPDPPQDTKAPDTKVPESKVAEKPAEPVTVAEAPKPEPRKPHTATIPAGTLLNVRIDSNLSTDTVAQGDQFRATLEAPLVVDGFVLAERGARIDGKIIEVTPPDRGLKNEAKLGVQITRIKGSDGQWIQTPTQTFTAQGVKENKKTALKVGLGAAIGAAIGAMAGGGKGAAIGAGAGGAAGGGYAVLGKGGHAVIAAETRVTFRLAQAVTVTEKL